MRPSKTSTITHALPFAVEALLLSNESTKLSQITSALELSKRHSYSVRDEEAGRILEGGQRIATRNQEHNAVSDVVVEKP